MKTTPRQPPGRLCGRTRSELWTQRPIGGRACWEWGEWGELGVIRSKVDVSSRWYRPYSRLSALSQTPQPSLPVRLQFTAGRALYLSPPSPLPPSPPQYCPTFIKYSEDQGRIIVGIKSGLSEVSGSKLGFNSSRSEEENCLSGKTFLVNSSQFQPRWNLTAKQVIKCKVSSRTLKIPTMEMWSFMSIFGIHFAVRERRDELLSHCLAKYQIWRILLAG